MLNSKSSKEFQEYNIRMKNVKENTEYKKLKQRNIELQKKIDELKKGRFTR